MVKVNELSGLSCSGLKVCGKDGLFVSLKVSWSSKFDCNEWTKDAD